MTIPELQQLVWEYYRTEGRVLPWRETRDGYAIAVSEIMLQQTQVERVIPKYQAFLAAAPSWAALATLETSQLLELWQGLGYNRRALALRASAQVVVRDHKGTLPATRAELEQLPGVGPYTAGALLAFVYDQPVVMIETNIRRVVLHHLFPGEEKVDDRVLMPVIEQLLDRDRPREWYYALMDYGAHLAKTTPNANRRSRTYTKQSQFSGSLRQLRGEVVRQLLQEQEMSVAKLVIKTGDTPNRVAEALVGLQRDGMIRVVDEQVLLSNLE
jgi:A/G-specific adenine glycosylase